VKEKIEKKWGEKMANPYICIREILPSSSKKKIKTNGASLLGSNARIYMHFDVAILCSININLKTNQVRAGGVTLTKHTWMRGSLGQV
jgi:hypothetical protein